MHWRRSLKIRESKEVINYLLYNKLDSLGNTIYKEYERILKVILKSTVRYLGIEVDDALEISAQTEV